VVVDERVIEISDTEWYDQHTRRYSVVATSRGSAANPPDQLPRGRPTLICGPAGCGKTLLAMKFLGTGKSTLAGQYCDLPARRTSRVAPLRCSPT
jgi:KaiC/GvpD/RAD55 family RecA-like ATPase